MLYAAETSLQVCIAETSEALRDLYVTAYSLPSTSEFIYRSTAMKLEKIFAEYLPDAVSKDFYELDIAIGICRGCGKSRKGSEDERQNKNYRCCSRQFFH